MWVAQWLSLCLQPRAWSWSPRIESHVGLLAWSLLLPLLVSLLLSLCLLRINKILKKKALKKSGQIVSILFLHLFDLLINHRRILPEVSTVSLHCTIESSCYLCLSRRLQLDMCFTLKFLLNILCYANISSIHMSIYVPMFIPHPCLFYLSMIYL